MRRRTSQLDLGFKSGVWMHSTFLIFSYTFSSDFPYVRVAQAFRWSDLGGAAPFTIPLKGAGFRLVASMQREREAATNPLVAPQPMGHPAEDFVHLLPKCGGMQNDQ